MNKPLLSLILFSAFSFSSYANTEKNPGLNEVSPVIQDTINVKDVVITATRTPKMLKDVPQITRVITSKDIEKMGKIKIEDVLSNELAGVEIHQAGYGTTMSFQGLDARYVLVMIDGERIAGETYGNIDFSRIPTEIVDKIEIVKGASSVLYGSNAMGATINIITKKPKDKVEVAGSYRYGGFYDKDFSKSERKDYKYNRKMDTPNTDASLYAGFNIKNLESSTNFNYTSSDAYMMRSKEGETRYYKTIDGKPSDWVYTSKDTAELSISGWQSYNVSQRFGYKFSEKVSAEISGSYYHKNRYDHLNTSGGLGMGGAPITPTDKDEWTYENNYGYDYKAKVTYKINDKNTLWFSFMNDTYFRRQDSMSIITPKQRHEYMTPRVLWVNTPNDRNRITVGVEYNKESLNYDLSQKGYDTRQNFNSFAIYAQDELKITDRLETVFGLRLENYGFSDIGGLFKNFVGKGDSDKEKSGCYPTPKVAFTYNFDLFTIRTNYSMGFRNPTLKEKYMSYYQPMMGMTIVGNPNLKPEKNNYVSVSGEYTSKSNKFNTSVNMYASYFRNKIDTYQSGKEIVYENTSKSEIYGIEWTGNLRLLSGWWLRANYNYVDINNKNTSENPMAQYINASPHTATIGTSYSYQYKKFNFGINISGQYIGEKKYEDRMPLMVFKPGSPRPQVIKGVYTLKLNDYTIWNAAINIRYNSIVTLTAGVDNIFNYKPAIVGFNSLVTPGASGYVGLSFAF